jgi:CheY-like chemotaxis protein
VLEDDADVATLLVTALGARGAEVEVARTAAELLERVSGDHDAVLVDLSPIADDVAGALDALRRTAPRAVVVFISGSAAALPDVFADEAIRWVRKPFEISEVLDALSDVWRR